MRRFVAFSLLLVLVFVCWRMTPEPAVPCSTGSDPVELEPAPTPAPVPKGPVETLAEACELRDWNAAEDLLARIPAESLADPRLDRLRDALERGARADREHVLTTRIPIRIGCLRGTSLNRLGMTNPGQPLTLRGDQGSLPLLAEWPRKEVETKDLPHWLSECLLLGVTGLVIPAGIPPSDLANLAHAPVSYLGGPGLDQMPVAVWSTLSDLEHLDAHEVAQPTGILNALTGHARMRVLALANGFAIDAQAAKSIASFTNLEDLSTGACAKDQRLIAGPWPALRTLATNATIDGPLLRELAKGSPHMTALTLSSITARGDDLLLLGSFTHLTRLDLGPLPAGELAILSRMASLDDLTLRPIPPGILPTPPRLSRFRLVLSQPLSWSTDAVGLDGLTQLRHLELIGPGCDRAALSAVATLPFLEDLVVDGAPITVADLASLEGSRRLWRLILRNCAAIQPADWPTLFHLGDLRELQLDGCPADEAAFLALTGAGTLESLTISRAPIFTDASVDRIATWTRRPRINLDQSKLTPEGRTRLQDLSRQAVPAANEFPTGLANDF